MMTKKILKITLILLFISASATSWADKKTNGFAKKLPEFSLKDPAGKKFTDKDISKDGLVLVVTAPILKNKDEQEGWDRYLNKRKRNANKAKLVFLQDMAPSSAKGTALKKMKEEYKPGEEPILLIDPKSKVRKKLNVPEKKTVVLVYDDGGELIHVEREKPSKAGARRIWKALK